MIVVLGNQKKKKKKTNPTKTWRKKHGDILMFHLLVLGFVPENLLKCLPNLQKINNSNRKIKILFIETSCS